ncbi:MAG: branched-chain amino acid transporter AzlC [Treponema sp. CETP13]|nr:MAG: branched-chain amino acid transporter AzlC [Treponema sp. CETP13]
MNRRYALQAVKITIPVFFGYLAIGIPFGLMVVNSGYPCWIAPAMSLFMYAGAGQYMAIGLLASNASLPVMFVTQLLLNSRHIVYGLSLIKPFRNVGKIKPYLVFALTDETYALMTSCTVPPNANPAKFYGLIAALDQSYWILGSIIGAVAGLFIPAQYLEGVDFALTLLFVVLLIDQIKSTKNPIPPIIGAICAILAIVIFGTGSNMLIAALCFGIVALIMLRQPLEKFEQKKEKSN